MGRERDEKTNEKEGTKDEAIKSEGSLINFKL